MRLMAWWKCQSWSCTGSWRNWCVSRVVVSWPTGSAFLSRVRHQWLPWVTSTQQKCHIASENGTAESLTFLPQLLCFYSIEKRRHFICHQPCEVKLYLYCQEEQQNGQGRPHVTALTLYGLGLAGNDFALTNFNVGYWVQHLCCHGMAKHVMQFTTI